MFEIVFGIIKCLVMLCFMLGIICKIFTGAKIVEAFTEFVRNRKWLKYTYLASTILGCIFFLVQIFKLKS